MKKLSTLFVSLLISISCWGQDTAFNSYDKDTDGRLSMEEFQEMLRDQKFFKLWDQNDDNFVSLEEWTAGLKEYYPAFGKLDYADYLNWDMDADKSIRDIEFTVGNFTLWDRNLDQYVDEDEWTQYKEWAAVNTEKAISSNTALNQIPH